MAAAAWQLASRTAKRIHCGPAHLVGDLDGPQQQDGGGHDAGNEQATAQGGGHCQPQVDVAACRAPEELVSGCRCLQFTTLAAWRAQGVVSPKREGTGTPQKRLLRAPCRCSSAAHGSLVCGEDTSVGLLVRCHSLFTQASLGGLDTGRLPCSLPWWRDEAIYVKQHVRHPPAHRAA